MFLLREPSNERVRRVLASQQDKQVTYPSPGATRSSLIVGYPVNHHRTRLGAGERVFDRAIAALHSWAMYRLPWTRLCTPDASVEPGTLVGVVARHLGFWSINTCRVVYVLEEQGDIDRVGFALGTLPEHAERGEERFTIEWHHSDDSVWFELLACAGANHWLARIGYPALRLIQYRFGSGATQAMYSAVNGRQDGEA